MKMGEGESAWVDNHCKCRIKIKRKSTKRVQKVFWGGYSGCFQDLDGLLWEVAHNPLFWRGPGDDTA